MKKLLLVVLFLPSGLNACLCDCFSDIVDDFYDASSFSPKQIEKKIQRFIENGNASGLDDFLEKFDIQTKKQFLSKRISVLSTRQSYFMTTYLNLAIYFDSSEIIKILVRHGADINASGGDGYSPLTGVVAENKTTMIRQLSALGADFNAYDANGNTALYVAVQYNQTNLVPLLVARGAKVNLANKKGLTPLNVAVDQDCVTMVEVLVKNGADINLAGADGYSPLVRAVDKNLPNMITLLIKLGANSNFSDKNGWLPLTMAVYNNNDVMVKLLVDHGANVNAYDANGDTALCLAAQKNYTNLVPLLIKLGADVNLAKQNGWYPLSLALHYKNNAIMETLIKEGADVNIANPNGNFPLHAALEQNNQAMIELMLVHQANINVQDFGGNAVLHKAIEKSYDNLVPLLLKYGADVRLKNDNHVSSILLAASYGKTELLKTLLKNQEPSISDFRKAITMNDFKMFTLLLAQSKMNPFSDRQKTVDIDFDALVLGDQKFVDVCCSNDKRFLSTCISGHLPLHYAVMYGHDALVRYFIEQCHIDSNEQDNYGFTALHFSALYGNYELTDYLIKKKCLINQQSLKDFDCYKNGSTPVDVAVQNGNSDIVALLTRYGAKTNLVHKTTIISDQTTHMVLFVDSTNEAVKAGQRLMSVKTAVAQDLRDVINQKPCPVIVIGQHLLQNALRLSCTLKDWLVVDFAWKDIGGYIIIPPQLIGSTTNFNVKLLDTKLQNLGLALSSMKHTYVDELSVAQKKIEYPTLKKEVFSSQVPLMLDALLMPRERFIFWDGHGLAKEDPTIGDLLSNDALQLLTILAQKKTKIVCVSSCFFGGKNVVGVGNFGDMIIISSATTEFILKERRGTMPHNWRGFFNALASYKPTNDFQSFCDYLANHGFPLIVSNKPNISNFPHIKFPGKPFTLLPINNQALLIDQKMVAENSTQKPLVVDNKRLLEMSVPLMKNLLEIKQHIPLIVSNLDKIVFEKMYINSSQDSSHAERNDLVYLFKKLTRAHLYNDSTLESTFLIKELKFATRYSLNMKKDAKKKLPETVYNVVVHRGPSSFCEVFLSTEKKPTLASSMCIAYDSVSKTWDSYTVLSAEEFDLYQRSL